MADLPSASRYRSILGPVHRDIDAAWSRMNPPPANVRASEEALSGAMGDLGQAYEYLNQYFPGTPLEFQPEQLRERLEILAGARPPAEGQSVRLQLGEAEKGFAATSLERLNVFLARREVEMGRIHHNRLTDTTPPPPLPRPGPQGLPPLEERVIPDRSPGFRVPDIAEPPTAPAVPYFIPPATPFTPPVVPFSYPPRSANPHANLPWWAPVDCGSCHAPRSPLHTPAPSWDDNPTVYTPPGWRR